jgi:hypothetical protein
VVDALAHHDPAWAASAMRTHILSGLGPARKASPTEGKGGPH